jgi:predicted DsbA family dithiol-disulfide isomerase
MHVEIWSDIVCPFCAIGKRRFEKALARFEHANEVTVAWRSFELNPEKGAAFDGTLDEWLAQHKGISIAQAMAMNDQVTAMAAAEGLTFNMRQARPANTFDAHRLAHKAEALGKRVEATDLLFKAYFEEGEDLADAATLANIGAKVGLPEAEVTSMLREGAYADSVRAEEQRAISLGIRAVPFFLIEGQYGISGAQAPEKFLAALNQMHDLIEGSKAN